MSRDLLLVEADAHAAITRACHAVAPGDVSGHLQLRLFWARDELWGIETTQDTAVREKSTCQSLGLPHQPEDTLALPL